MAAIMILAFLTVIGNLVADVLYGVMDPRVRFD
jgi:peptide/nickel transport system permease protein